MYPGIKINPKRVPEELIRQINQEAEALPTADQLTEIFHTHVEDGDYEIKEVMGALTLSDTVFTNITEATPARLQKEHDSPDQDVVVDTMNGWRPFDKEKEKYLESDYHRHCVIKYDAFGEGKGRLKLEHSFEVPQDIRQLRKNMSSGLMQFVKDISVRESNLIGESTSMYGNEDFAKTAWTKFVQDYSLDKGELRRIKDTVKSWETGTTEGREKLAENPLIWQLSEYNQDLLRDLYGDEAQIPLRRGITINHEIEDELNEDSTLRLERSLPDSWGFKDLVAYRRSEDYGLGVDIRNTVDIDDVVLSPHLLNGLMDYERGEWILDDEKEEFSEDEYCLVHLPEAEFYEPEMIWTYEKLKEENIV